MLGYADLEARVFSIWSACGPRDEAALDRRGSYVMRIVNSLHYGRFMVCSDTSFSTHGAYRALTLRRVELCDEGDPLLTLVQRAHEESRFAYALFSRRKARRVLVQALTEGPRHLVMVAEYRGRPQGFVYASAGEYLVASDAVMATINAIYTAADLRGTILGGRISLGLFRAVGQWAQSVGAREILLHATSGIAPDRLARTVTRMGFKPLGGSYVGSLI